MKKCIPLMAAGLLFAGAFMAAKPAKADSYCREYTRTVTIGNSAREAYGTACYQPDGSWKIVDEDGGNAEGKRFVLNGSGYNNVVFVNDRVIRPAPRTSSSLAVGGKNYFFSYSTGTPSYYYRPPVSRVVFYDNSRRHDNGWHRGHDRGHDGHHRH
jgi:surface antigen